jgi:hypothetical protein
MRVLTPEDAHKLETYDYALESLEEVIGDLLFCVATETGEELKNSVSNAIKDLERIADWMHDFDDC